MRCRSPLAASSSASRCPRARSASCGSSPSPRSRSARSCWPGRLGREADAPHRDRAAVLEHAPDAQHLRPLRLRRPHRTFTEPYAGWKPALVALTASLPFLRGLTLNETWPVALVALATARM